MPSTTPKLNAISPSEVNLYTPRDLLRYALTPLLPALGHWHWGGREEWFFEQGFAEERSPEFSFRQLANCFVSFSVVYTVLQWERAEESKTRGWLSFYDDSMRFVARLVRDESVFDPDPVAGVDRLITKSVNQFPSAKKEWLRKWANTFLDRVELAEGVPVRLYPFTRDPGPGQPRVIVIDPRVRFGRPVVAGRGVPTDSLFDRYRAGDSAADLAEDYGVTTEEVDEAVRFEARSPAVDPLPFSDG